MNVTINQSEVVSDSFDFLKNKTSGWANNLSNFISNNLPGDVSSKLILIFVVLLIIWGASKITNKLAKIGLIIVGVLILVGIVLSFL